ncbi:ACP S-malonyltransferase [Bacillus atrophaeus]|uniref:ACP S-malonyltransferase n=1 Tax=Bacillus atrophaeus TaxID=1452 RepID=UPI0021630507|nr:ACP S-malonyltransferase [Bacillus atrophaeus]
MNIACLFPGQGAQYIGMGEEFFDKYDYVKEIYQKASEVLNIDISQLCFRNTEQELNKTENAQLALFVSGYAAYQVTINELKFSPSFLAGHSLGEITALSCAGAIEFEDALNIIKIRANLMHEAEKNVKGGMLAVNGLEKDQILHFCRKMSHSKESLVIACENSPEQFVIAGEITNLENLLKSLQSQKATATMLPVSGPFHSPYMKEAASTFENKLKTFKLSMPKSSVVSSVTGELYNDITDVWDNLSNQLIKPVYWSRVMQFLKNKELKYFIDIGPRTLLKNLVSYNNLSANVLSINEALRLGVFKKSDINLIKKYISIIVSTKNRNWDNDDYEKKVVENLTKLKKLLKQNTEYSRKLTLYEEQHAYELFEECLLGKGITKEEKDLILNKSKLF